MHQVLLVFSVLLVVSDVIVLPINISGTVIQRRKNTQKLLAYAIP